jgi:hypothetical protein
MVNISSGYYIEQALVVIVSAVSMLLAVLQVRAHSIWRDATKALHRKLHPTIFAGTVLALVWAIDPRGQYKVYPWYVLGFMKDHMIILLFYSGSVWITQVIKVLFEVNNKAPPKRLEMVLSSIPSFLLWFVVVICDGVRVAKNAVWPSSFILMYIGVVVFIWGSAVLWCVRIVRATNKAVSGKVNESQQAARNKVMRKLYIGAITCWLVTIFEFYQAYVTYVWVGTEEANQVPEATSYTAWTFVYVWLVVDAALFYVAWLPVLRKPDPVAPQPPSDNNSGGHRGSKTGPELAKRNSKYDGRGSTSSNRRQSNDPVSPKATNEKVTALEMSSETSAGAPDRPSMGNVTSQITPIREATAENLQPI